MLAPMKPLIAIGVADNNSGGWRVGEASPGIGVPMSQEDERGCKDEGLLLFVF